MTAFTNNGFLVSTKVYGIPAPNAMLFVLGLIILAGILIWIYIRFVILSDSRYKKKQAYASEKEKLQNSDKFSDTDSNTDYIDYMDYIESIDDPNLDNYANTRKKNKNKAKKNKNKKNK